MNFAKTAKIAQRSLEQQAAWGDYLRAAAAQPLPSLALEVAHDDAMEQQMLLEVVHDDAMEPEMIPLEAQQQPLLQNRLLTSLQTRSSE